MAGHPRTQGILAKLGDPEPVLVAHYKDVFCRRGQDRAMQRQSRKLILAAKKAPFLYPASDLCDAFGHPHFFYSSNAMNCLYDCEYCYLQGLYPSAHLVVFVNVDDIFREVDRELARHPVYLSNSYDTDLAALEGLTGLCAEWIGFARSRPDLTLEIRTKSAGTSLIRSVEPASNVILAWSVSPQGIASAFEHGTPSVSARIGAMRQAIDEGWKVRLCVDPMIRTPDWKSQYASLIRSIRTRIRPDEFYEHSVGVFRVPADSLRTMRRIRPESAVLAYPFARTADAGPDVRQGNDENENNDKKDRMHCTDDEEQGIAKIIGMEKKEKKEKEKAKKNGKAKSTIACSYPDDEAEEMIRFVETCLWTETEGTVKTSDDLPGMRQPEGIW